MSTFVSPSSGRRQPAHSGTRSVVVVAPPAAVGRAPDAPVLVLEIDPLFDELTLSTDVDCTCGKFGRATAAGPLVPPAPTAVVTGLALAASGGVTIRMRGLGLLLAGSGLRRGPEGCATGPLRDAPSDLNAVPGDSI